MKRPGSLRTALVAMTMAAVHSGWPAAESRAATQARPNVVVIITDDQGYGDLGVHGNPRIRTPNIDRLAKQSARLKQFYVSPVCSLTRASLLTGRYNYRTGVVDTYRGRSMMHPDELTLAERLRREGYRTGIFGKWHLGDNAPLRPIDQGFQEALVLKGGGIGQPSDLPGGSHYQDPVLLHNGQPRRYEGYCSDVYTTAATEFLNASAGTPFFLYLAFNCPHEPLEPPGAEYEAYRGEPLGSEQYPKVGNPLPRAIDEDKVARIYAMVSNIDANVGRLMDAIDSQGLTDSTIVVFLTDNGPAFPRFNAGLRDLKGSVYEGGIRVPGYVRWPGHFPAGIEVDRVAAHIDLVPTLLDACAIPAGADPPLDGRSLLPLLRVDAHANWPDRTLYFQWHRGDAPEPGRAFAARSQSFKLLRPEARGGVSLPPLELYDIEHDPFEQHDLAAMRPDVVSAMYRDYQAWFRDVSATRGYAPIRIEIGGPRENPTLLTRQDRRGQGSKAKAEGVGYWELLVSRAGRYAATAHIPEGEAGSRLHLVVEGVSLERPIDRGAGHVSLPAFRLKAGPARLEAWTERDGSRAGVLDVTVSRIDED